MAHHKVSCTVGTLFEPIKYGCSEDCGTLFPCIRTLVAEGVNIFDIAYSLKLKTHVVFSFQWLNKTALRAANPDGTSQPLLAQAQGSCRLLVLLLLV